MILTAQKIVSCSVATCRNSQCNTKGKHVIFHRFPQKNEGLSKEWIWQCKRKDNLNPKNARICSYHFVLSDYLENLWNRYLGLPKKRHLKESSVPSINLPFINADYDVPWSKRHEKRNIFQNAFDKLKCLSPKKTSLE